MLSFHDASLRFGARTLWQGLDFGLSGGEVVAVLGGNGTGKTSMIRAILRQQELSSGTIRFAGEPVRRGDRRIGYVPQQSSMSEATPIRGVDFVAFGLTGHRFGVPLHRRTDRQLVHDALEHAGAADLARVPMSVMSGGEQQRLRVAQALVSRPRLLLCDEPIASLDLARQRDICGLIDRARTETGCGVLLITHDINPVLQMVDRVVYLANGEVRVGTVEEVFTAECLSAMYQTPIEVLHTHGRIVVVGAFGDESAHGPAHDHDADGGPITAPINGHDHGPVNGSVRPGAQRVQ